MGTLCGIDDAGKGPVIGPMVLAGVLIDEKDLPKLKAVGVKDSKLLTAKQRENLYPKILEVVRKYKIIKIPPEEIDKAVLSDNGYNLNWLEGEKMAEIINTLRPNQVIVDCPSNNKKAFAQFLQNKLTVKTSLRCEHKAEVFPTVAAASILAKVTRDREIELIKKKIGLDFNSGYPSDPITKQFLKENWNKYPEIFRRSWSTYQEFSQGKKSKKQKSLEDF